MGIARVANAVTTYIWFSSFYTVLILGFLVGFHPLTCEVFWADRLWCLFLLIPFTGVSALVNFARRQPADWDAEWWARYIHNVVSFLLLMFFAVVFFAYLVPAFATRNCQPDGNGLPDICEGGKCGNPFNDPAWFCVYNNTAEAGLCEIPPCMTDDLCDLGHDPANLDTPFAHFWLFVCVIIFLVLGVVDLVLMWNIHRLSVEMRLLAKGGAQMEPGFRAPQQLGAVRVESGVAQQRQSLIQQQLFT